MRLEWFKMRCLQKHGPVEINFQLKFVKRKSNHSSFQSFGPVEVKEKSN